MPPTGSHITIRPEGDGADVRALFADQPVGRTRLFSGAIVHVLAITLLLAVVRFLPKKAYETILPDRLSEDIVWLAQPGPGGGGGGNPKPEPPKLEPVKEPVTVPAVKPPEPVPLPVIPIVEPPSILPTETLAVNLENTVGAIAPPSLNPGGSGTGTGAGPGDGPGVGPGSGGGSGGDVFQPGNGVESPVALRQVRPSYTADAMRARVQGIVGLDCVVLRDGTVGPCNIAQGLKPAFGLEEEAIKAARQWRFRPGTRQGQPVQVLVRIELQFSLR